MNIRNAVVPIMGHWQRKNKQNGTRKLWRDLRLICTAETTVLPPQRWKSDWKALASWLSEELVAPSSDEPARVVICGYSYGGGWGAQQLTKYLGIACGDSIDVWQVLSDPVSRYRFGPLWPLNALNVSRWSGKWRSITLDRCVSRCVYFTQAVKPPFGQRVRGIPLHGADVRATAGVNRGHMFMDELPGYHAAASKLVQELNA